MWGVKIGLEVVRCMVGGLRSSLVLQVLKECGATVSRNKDHRWVLWGIRKLKLWADDIV